MIQPFEFILVYSLKRISKKQLRWRVTVRVRFHARIDLGLAFAQFDHLRGFQACIRRRNTTWGHQTGNEKNYIKYQRTFGFFKNFSIFLIILDPPGSLTLLEESGIILKDYGSFWKILHSGTFFNLLEPFQNIIKPSKNVRTFLIKKFNF